MPDPRWRSLQRAALGCMAVLLSLGLLLALAPPGVSVATLQPGEALAEAAEAVETTNAYPGWAVAFFLGDTLFVACGLWLYLSLGRLASPPRWLALAALSAGILKCTADGAENAIHLYAAWEAFDGVPWEDPPLPLLALLASLKRAGAAGAALMFGLLLPGRLPAARLARLMLLATGVAALVGFFVESVEQLHTTLLFLSLPLLVWLARSRRHAD